VISACARRVRAGKQIDGHGLLSSQNAISIRLVAQDWRDAGLTTEPTARNLDVYLYQYDL
jgi:hypothetical protein